MGDGGSAAPGKARGLAQQKGWLTSEKAWATVVALVVHAGLGWWLANQTWSSPAARQDVRFEIEFMDPLPSPAEPEAGDEARGAPAEPLGGSTRPAPGRSLTAGEKSSEGPATGAAGPLDLSLPSSMQAVDLAPRPLGERTAALEYRATRFEQDWDVEGNVVERLASRNVAVGLLAGAFQGKHKQCSDEQKRRREPGCVPDQYRGE